MRLKTLLPALLVFGLTGLTASAQIPVASDFTIGPRDLLEISVFGHPDLDTQIRVSEQGSITFPLIQQIQVAGLTAQQLENEISRKLAERYIKNPQVTVAILEHQSKRVSVLGAVGKQGQFELWGGQTLLEIISQAGGFSQDAADNLNVIRKTPGGGVNTLAIPIARLLTGDQKFNIILQPNDIVNVPIDRMVNIYVFGQVGNQGALQVRQSKIPTLLMAIAQAGGFGPRARKGSVQVKRLDARGREQIIKIDANDILKGKRPDFQLKENDVVYVPESIF